MARIRTIKPQFFTSEDVTAQAPLARLLFIGLFTECDREGRVEDRPRTLKMRLLPEDDVDVDTLLWSLVDGGLIRRYEANGQAIIQVTGFQRHQKPHPKEADSLLPKDGTDRQKPHLNTASREQVINHPVENPSSPAVLGREGVSIREGKESGNGAHARMPVQGSGAFDPGSLPRDHLHHSICGPSMRVCLKTWECGELMRQYGGDETKRKDGVRAFVAAFEQSLGPDDAIGAFSEVEKNFQTWLKSIGRAPAKMAAPVPTKSPSAKPDAVQEAMETRRRRSEMQAQGMTDEAIEAVFEREYQERRSA